MRHFLYWIQPGLVLALGLLTLGAIAPVPALSSLPSSNQEESAPPQNPLAKNAKPVPADGTPVIGELTSNSNVLPVDNSYFDAYTFEGYVGQQVVIDMVSNDFNSFLILILPDAANVLQDDDSGGGSNAQITTVLPQDGSYIVLANSLSAGETGDYTLSVTTENNTSQVQSSLLKTHYERKP